MALKEMYSAKVNSPYTTIMGNLDPNTTEVTVQDTSLLPEAPNLLVLGTDETAETVLMTAKNGNTLSINRGFQGVASSWIAGTQIARNFTAYDHDTFKDNIEDLSSEITVLNETVTNNTNEINNLIDNLQGFKIYSNVNQIINTPCVILDVIVAMSNKSMLKFGVSNTQITDLPCTYGEIEITKITNNYNNCIVTEVGTGRKFYCTNHEQSSTFSGWKQIATTDKIDISFPYNSTICKEHTSGNYANKLYKDSLGRVNLLLSLDELNGTKFTVGQTYIIGTLPVGYRPIHSFSGCSSHPGSNRMFGYFIHSITGDVCVIPKDDNLLWISMNVSFISA